MASVCLQSARGLGAVLGSSFYIAYGQQPYQGKILLASAIFYGISFAVFGLAPNYGLAVGLMTLVGLTDTVWSASRGASCR